MEIQADPWKKHPINSLCVSLRRFLSKLASFANIHSQWDTMLSHDKVFSMIWHFFVKIMFNILIFECGNSTVMSF